MPRNRPRYPIAGLIAFAVSFAVFCAQFALFAMPLEIAESPLTASEWSDRAHREAEESKARGMRLLTGLVAMLVGSGVGGTAAFAATRGRHTDRALAAAAGVCCIGSVVVWLIVAGAYIIAEPSQEPKPVLRIDRN